MFPPLRMDNLFPVDLGIRSRAEPDSIEGYYNRFKNMLPQEGNINPALTRSISGGPPTNRYAPPFTTNNLVSQGLTPANTQIDTKAAPSEISPLDKAKLFQNQEKITNSSNNNLNNLNFKQTKQEEDNAVRTNRAAIYKFKAENPGMKFDFSGPTVKIGDPIKGSVHDTGIPTGHLSDEDKLNLQNTNALEQIGQRGIQSRETNTRSNNERANNEINNITTRDNETRKTNAAKPENNSSTQQRVGYANKARELANSNPDLAPFIKMNGNEFSVSPPYNESDWVKNGKPSSDQYHKINEYIYGSSRSNDQNKSNSSKNENKDNKSSSFASSTTKHFTSAKNPKGWDIPMDKVDEFLKDNPEAQEAK